MALLEGTIFTNKRLKGNPFFITGTNFITDDNCMSCFRAYDLNSISDVYDANLKPIEKEDFIKYNSLNSNEFTSIYDRQLYVDSDNVKQVAHATTTFSSKEDTTLFKLLYLETNPNYRDLGLSKTLMEVVKSYGHFKEKSQIIGQMAPLGKLKNKNPMKPATNVESQVFHTSLSNLDEYNADKYLLSMSEGVDNDYLESFFTLKEIYNHLGFDVQLRGTESGKLNYDLTKFEPTDNYYNILGLICGEKYTPGNYVKHEDIEQISFVENSNYEDVDCNTKDFEDFEITEM